MAATPIVLGTGDGFQVLGIHARPHAAEVIEFKTLGDRADLLFVHAPMSHERDPPAVSTPAPLAVPIPVATASPNPTAVVINEVTRV